MDNLRRRIILAAASTPAPTGKVAYIRGGDDGSYIDTGIIPDINTRVVVWARNWIPYSEHLFGSRTAMGSDEFALCAPSKTSVDRMRAKINGYETYMDGAITKYFSNYHKYEMGRNQVFVDDVLVGELIETALTSSFSIHLFGVNDGGTHLSMKYPVDIIACKIYQDDVLVMDLVPVLTPSIGFYDSVSRATLTNAGSGSLSYKMYNPNAYKPLKYVSSTAEQYAETGIIGGYSPGFVAQVATKASVPKWNIPVSGRYSTSKRCEYFFGNTSTANYNLSAGYSGNTNQISTDGFYGVKINLTKSGNTFDAYKDNAQIGTQKTFNADTGYTTNQPFVIGGTFENGAFKPSESFEGDIYYVGFGKNENYVPALSGDVAGFYDTYNDEFHASKTATQFIAGPEVDERPQPKRVSYIRGGGDGSYIDTGIIPDSTTTITIWARNFAPNGYEYTWLAGSRIAHNNSAFDIYADYRNGTGRLGFVYANTSTRTYLEGWKYFTDYHKYEIRNGALFVDDTCVACSNSNSFSTTLPIHIIGHNDNGQHVDSNMRLDICGCQIYKGGQLVRDFTPSAQNGMIGLYDSVSNTLFTNAGTGSFKYGIFDTDAYTRLEYINAYANAYFDSNVYGKYTDSMVCKFMPTGRIPRWHAIFGCRIEGSVFEISFGRNATGEDNRRIYWRMGPNSGATYNVTPYNSANLTGKELVFYKPKDSANIYITTGNSAQIGSATINGLDSTFITNKTLAIGTFKTDDGFETNEAAYGRYYYLRFGYERSFVPAQVNGVAGMYDTYNDYFYQSTTENPFVAGPPLIV